MSSKMDTHEKVMDLALRRGFLWPSFEIYGGVSGFYDYGPLGATLKKKLEDKWRQLYCIEEGFLEIFSPTVAPEEVFIASGHVSGFIDPMVECTKCKQAFRVDHLIKAAINVNTNGLSYKELDRLVRIHKIRCPECGGEFSEVWSYNLMFKTHIGPGNVKVGYLRPETAQGMFLLFNRLYGFYRKKLPFGVAQIGKAYRNEISPRQGVIRLREFSQAEVEIFVDPREKTCKNFKKYADEKIRLLPRNFFEKEIEITAKEAVEKRLIAHELLCYHLMLAKKFLKDIGLSEDKLRFRQHAKSEIAHYAADCWDAEVYTERFGWIEVVGIADRTSYDLEAHEKLSGMELKAFLQYEEPKIMKKKVVEPNMNKIGPNFKEIAAKVLRALKRIDESAVNFFEKNGFLELEIEGRKIKLDKDYISIKEVEEKIFGEKITPHVVEPSYGIDRIVYCVLEHAYSEIGKRMVLSLKNSIAPVEVAIFPLVSKEELNEIALNIHENLKKIGLVSMYDDADSIGRRYARVDEIGVPYAITVDFDTLKDKKVTIRERDSAEQKRIKVKEVSKILKELLEERKEFKEL